MVMPRSFKLAVNSVLPLELEYLFLGNSTAFNNSPSLDKALKEVEKSIQWVIGDWLNYGKRHYNQEYTQALEIVDYTRGSLHNIAWVCGAVELSRRREDLGFNHHIEGYWSLGKRIKEDKNMQKYAKGNWSSFQDLGKNIGISTSTIYYALQAHEKYPDIQLIPEGRTLTP